MINFGHETGYWLDIQWKHLTFAMHRVSAASTQQRNGKGAKSPAQRPYLERNCAGHSWSPWKNKREYVLSTARMRLSKLTDFATRNAAGDTRSISQTRG
jgi:hypothetical protein